MVDNRTPDELDADDADISPDADPSAWRDRDGVSSLRDTEAEQGDEEEIEDAFDLDSREAQELDAALGGSDGQEPKLD